MSTRRFKQVDVFTRVPYLGNPVAVVLDAEGLSGAQMQRIAGWTNLSETTFVLPPQVRSADYRLRIFTPRAELPFAGHPTLGSAHAVLEAGLARPRDGLLRQECGAGLVTIAVEDDAEARLWLASPPTRVSAVDRGQFATLDQALGIPFERDPPPQIVDVGPVWLVVRLSDARRVASLRPDLAAVAAFSTRLGLSGVVAFGQSQDAESAIHLRAFAPAHGIAEDPVCGSGNISVAASLTHTGWLERIGARYRARQGMALGRDGRIALRVEDGGGRIWLGGDAVTCIDGALQT
ncbi:MAG: PhzF family phenazine biosynthesis protein [Burkholderiales bacterium]|nr:PhzF family phenazine biosynthesis protein [Burkholderiales bacterium]